MLIKKTEVLQIRLESELLQRFRTVCDEMNVSVSPFLRYQMLKICDSYDEQKRRKQDYLLKQSDKKR